MKNCTERAIQGLLLILTAVAFWELRTLGFVSRDDPGYVFQEPMVNQGLRGAAFLWALTAQHGGNWHPLTSLSHMLDCSLFGLNAGAHHLVNLGIHAINVVLVYVTLSRLTGARWRSAFVSACFAIHPSRVESVAWISERKDVLSTMFWLSALLAYARYVEQRSRWQYGLVIVFFVLGLLSKSMLVTLPCVLLLLDFWPLSRARHENWRVVVMEKLPLFVVAAAFAVVTLWFQRSAGAMQFGDTITFGMRLGNAMIAYVRYLHMLVWPVHLSPLYPHPGAWPMAQIALATIMVGGLSYLAWNQRVNRPWLTMGWFWFVGTLVPVIGLIQVGRQAMADRYTYVSFLGLFVICAWAGGELVSRYHLLRWPVRIASGAFIVLCVWKTSLQSRVWRDGVTLAEHAMATVGAHPAVLEMLGNAYTLAGRSPIELAEFYRRAMERYPEYPYFHGRLGIDAAERGDFASAFPLFAAAQRLSPGDPVAYTNLAVAHIRRGAFEDAERNLREALRLKPFNATARFRLAQVQYFRGQLHAAADEYQQAVHLDRWNWVAWDELGSVYQDLGRLSAALGCYERALWINPRDDMATRHLSALRKRVDGGTSEGIPRPDG